MLSDDLKVRLLTKMHFMRLVEEEIASRYPNQQMRCPVHLSIGQEGVPAGFALAVRKSDYAVSTHRGHAHYLAKGGDPKAMIAEIYGRATGCSKGKGGSMHLIDQSVRFMGSTAIVGNSIPIGVGLGLASQINGSDDVSCIFLGDGAVEEGVFFESVNFAAVKKLPVLFICENNLYSVYSPLSVRQPEGRNIACMVQTLGVDSVRADGNDVEIVFSVLSRMFDEIRSGGGPRFVEFLTYRWREHCGPSYDDELGYRTDDEVAFWKAKDPIDVMTRRINDLSPDLLADVQKELLKIRFEIDDAFRFAERSPFPLPEDAYVGVFADE